LKAIDEYSHHYQEEVLLENPAYERINSRDQLTAGQVTKNRPCHNRKRTATKHPLYSNDNYRFRSGTQPQRVVQNGLLKLSPNEFRLHNCIPDRFGKDSDRSYTEIMCICKKTQLSKKLGFTEAGNN
jgi:hypothetical protein